MRGIHKRTHGACSHDSLPDCLNEEEAGIGKGPCTLGTVLTQSPAAVMVRILACPGLSVDRKTDSVAHSLCCISHEPGMTDAGNYKFGASVTQAAESEPYRQADCQAHCRRTSLLGWTTSYRSGFLAGQYGSNSAACSYTTT